MNPVDDILETLKRWGNYDTANSDRWELQVCNELIQFQGRSLRSVDRCTHIDVYEVRKSSRVNGVFIPGNILLGSYQKSDNLWQAKALLKSLSTSETGVEILTKLVKELYNDEEGRRFLTDTVETLKSEERLEELSRIVLARMMMNQ